MIRDICVLCSFMMFCRERYIRICIRRMDFSFHACGVFISKRRIIEKLKHRTT